MCNYSLKIEFPVWNYLLEDLGSDINTFTDDRTCRVVGEDPCCFHEVAFHCFISAGTVGCNSLREILIVNHSISSSEMAGNLSGRRKNCPIKCFD